MLLVGCASSGKRTGSNEDLFPPNPFLPLSIALVPPLSLSQTDAAETSLAAWHSSPARRQLLRDCVWTEGAAALASLTTPATAVTSLLPEINPLGPTPEWVNGRPDSLQGLRFVLRDRDVLDQARFRQWSHLVVPGRILYAPAAHDSTQLVLSATVAVIDVLEKEIVWQGEVRACSQDLPCGRPGPDGPPPLTAYERATYAWWLELFEVFGRMQYTDSKGLEELGLRCQEPGPVFSLGE